MKFCPKCGSELPEDALFCGACGAHQAEKDKLKRSGSDNSKIKKIIILVVAVVLIVTTVIIVVVVSKEKEKERERERTAQLLTYKADDVTSAAVVATRVNTALANEGAYDDLMMNNVDESGEIIAVALSGEPFQAYGGYSLDHFIKELNREGASPVLKYTEPVKGWTPAGWAIAMKEFKTVVYITDGTTSNMVEVNPEVSIEYR